MGTDGNVRLGLGTLYIKAPYTAGSWVEVGYTEGGARLIHTPQYETGRPWFSHFPVKSRLEEEIFLVEIILLESTIINMKTVMTGYSSDSSSTSLKFNYDMDGTHDFIGFKSVFVDTNASPTVTETITVPYCRQEGSPELNRMRVIPNRLIAQFRVFDNGTDVPLTIAHT